MGFIEKLQSPKGKVFMGYLYGWGASIVIIGAMFKIQHWPGASPMLVCGLSIEAVIFFFSAFEPVHPHDDWGLVYPELRQGDGHGHGDDHKIAHKDPVAAELDKMLQDAKIGPELIESLGSGMKSLSDQASKLTDITDASVATKGYTDSLKDASKNVGQLSQSYSSASQSLTALAGSAADGQHYANELAKVSSNLASLNAVYEMQLKEANSHISATKTMYEGMDTLTKNLNDSVADTQKYKEQVAKLATNLSALNTVYGNMLSAMNVK
jgi:gliding motility-associated protein GldL